jgi:hypothetical protein
MNMHAPRDKRKSSAEINIYRDACRDLVAGHMALHPCHKVILMRLVDYVNRHTWDAFVGAETLAADCTTTVRSVRRALKSGRNIGIIEQTYRGNTGRPSRYIFRTRLPDTLDEQPDTDVTLSATTTGHFEPNYRTLEVLLPDTDVTLTSEITSETLTSERGAPPSSSFRNSDVGSPKTFSDNQSSEEAEGSEKRSGERGPEGPKSEPSPDYGVIRAAILSRWETFSATIVNKHMRIYGPAKTLEVVECAARLGKPDVNKVLETPLMDWSAPQIVEIEYTPEVRRLYQESIMEAA